MSRKMECATGVDLDRAVADGKIALGDADAVRAFQRFLQMAPPAKPAGEAYTRDELVRYRAALVEYDEDAHSAVIAKIDSLLARPSVDSAEKREGDTTP